MNKMNPEVKAKWLAALRSGEYEQGKEALRDENNRYCCLGVLCDLHAQEYANAQWERVSNRAVYSFLDSYDYLPRQVCDWSGVSRQGMRDEGEALHLLNDGGKTFAEIADIIEAEF